MGKFTVGKKGTIKIKMDTPDDVYYDAKDPHVSFEQNGTVTLRHLDLYSVDGVVGSDREEKAAVYWVREHKQDLINMYKAGKPYFIDDD